MNEAAANALYEAERKGVKQIKGETRDEFGGRCAMGVLEDAVQDFPLRCHTKNECPMCGATRATFYSDEGPMSFVNEANIVAHLNDHHGLTFSEIARKLGPDAA